jgi:hypothetical protein
MKIRIKGNSLRYRLTKTDIERFNKHGYIEEITDFGEQQLIYALQRYTLSNLTASLQNNVITLFIPAHMVNELATTERVGFDGNDNQLYLLIEKDFKCLDAVTEDQSDNYPNPLLEKKD